MTPQQIEAMKLALVVEDFDNNDESLPLELLKPIAATLRALAQPEQEPVAHLWECLGRWSAYLVNNGTQAECAPPSWLVEAVKNATTPPQRTEQEPIALHCCGYTDASAVKWNPFNGVVQCHNCGQTYTPPQRKPLTDDLLTDLWYKQSLDWMEFARAIEATHGIKENT